MFVARVTFEKKGGEEKSTLFNAFALPRDCGRDCIGRQKKVGAGGGGKQQIHFEFAKL